MLRIGPQLKVNVWPTDHPSTVSEYRCRVTMECSMRFWSISLLLTAACLAACGPSIPQRSELPAGQYEGWAVSFARIEHCYSTGRLSPDDAVALRRTANENLARYTFDAAAINQMTQQMLTIRHQIEADPNRQRDMVEVCDQLRQTAVSNRAVVAQNRATELHQAQMAAAQAQIQSAQAASWQPQPFVMPQYPTYRPPQVQTPQLGGGSSYFYCNQLSSHVVTCR